MKKLHPAFVLESLLGLMVLLLVVHLALSTRSESALPTLLNANEAGALTDAAWAGLRGEASVSQVATQDRAKAVIVAAYFADKNARIPPMQALAAGSDLAQAAHDAAVRLSAKLRDRRADGVTVHLVTAPARLHVDLAANQGWTFDRGLDGLMLCRVDECRALPGPLMHARSLSYAGGQSWLKKDRGVSLEGAGLPDGWVRYRDVAWISRGPGEALPLFRASTLLDEPTAAQVMDACKLGGDMLTRLQQPSGKWYYGYEAGRDSPDKTDYNLLRHAGTTYALYQLFGATGEARYWESAENGLRFLRTVIESARDDPKRMYVRESKSIKLGGAGLALIAYMEKATVGSLSDDDKRVTEGLVRHCLESQNPDGSFASYHSTKGVKAKTRRSIYYPGEAMLGLIRFYQRHPERTEVLEAVQRAAAYLVDERWRMLGIEFNIPPDAWLMLALEELHQADPDPRWAKYCFKIARGMDFDQLGSGWGLDFAGGYYPSPPQVTPAGSRSEGLTAAWLLAERLGDQATMDSLKRTIARSARFQIDRMIRPEFALLFPNPRMALGVFRHSPVSNTMRIDYNQHNISGLLVATRILGR